MTVFDGFAIVPAVAGDDYVELSTTAKGRVFRKQILHYGELNYPGVGKVKVDEAFADKLIENFGKRVVSSVQIPKADEQNRHSEAPDRNLGEVIKVLKGKNGVYVDMDVREEADKIGSTYLGTSAMLHLNMTDRRTGEKVGPTLIHNCVTNNAFIPDLEDFEEIVALSASSADITGQNNIVVLTPALDTEERTHMSTLDELFEELKTAHGIDVPELQKKSADADKAVALSNKIQEELVGTGLLKLTAGEEVDADTLVGAVAEAGDRIVQLTSKVDTLIEDGAKKEATAEVDKLVLTGYILPKDKEAMLELRLTNADLFEKLRPKTPIIRLSVEDGVIPDADGAHEETVLSEVARLTEVASKTTNAFIRS